MVADLTAVFRSRRRPHTLVSSLGRGLGLEGDGPKAVLPRSGHGRWTDLRPTPEGTRSRLQQTRGHPRWNPKKRRG